MSTRGKKILFCMIGIALAAIISAAIPFVFAGEKPKIDDYKALYLQQKIETIKMEGKYLNTRLQELSEQIGEICQECPTCKTCVEIEQAKAKKQATQ